MAKSLQTVLRRSFWLISVLSCILAVSITAFFLNRHSFQQAEDRIRVEEANLVSLGVLDLISLNVYSDIVSQLPDALRPETIGEIVRVYDSEGRPIFSNGRASDLEYRLSEKGQKIAPRMYIVQGKTRRYLTLYRNYRAADDRMLWLQIATPITQPIESLGEIALPFSTVLLFLIALAYILSHGLTLHFLRPIRAMGEHLMNLEAGGVLRWQPLSEQKRFKELEPILEKFNEFISRIQSAVIRSQYIGRFIAHEVRTPLTVLRGEMEMAKSRPDNANPKMDELLASALEEIEKLEHIVTTVLHLSSGEKGKLAIAPETLNLKEFVRDELPIWERLVQRPIGYVGSAIDSATVFADRSLLKLLVSNLLRNVVKHGPPDTKVKIAVGKGVDSAPFMEIEDDGIGLSENTLQAVNSGELDTPALGIGLVLCKQIALLSQLKLDFLNVQPHGLKVRITTPPPAVIHAAPALKMTKM